MTREKAIQWLKHINITDWCEQSIREAIDMAIEALKELQIREQYSQNYETDDWVKLGVTNKNKEKVILYDAFGELEYYPIEALSADAVSREAHYDAIANRITDMEERGFVSVVRCKDCRYCTEYYDRDGYPYWECAEWDGGTDADGFCHYGERREPSAEQTEYKLPGHDEVMDALDKLTLRGDKDE